jgi:HK97 gp10 family phage protein
MANTIRFLGAENLRDKFIAMTEEARREVLEKSVPEAADILMQNIIDNAPVGDGSGGYWKAKGVSGHHMKDDISKETVEHTEDRLIQEVKVSRDGFYWRFVEFGTPHAPAHPFARPAVKSSKTPVTNEIRDSMRDVIFGFTE